jgi:hypothetical protein
MQFHEITVESASLKATQIEWKFANSNYQRWRNPIYSDERELESTKFDWNLAKPN